MGNQKVTLIVLLDLLAAFDTVDHDLMQSIYGQKFDITGTALQWYNSYLRPRWMKVCVEGAYSSQLSIKYGVPQGSCSGANNFTAYCSPIADVVPAGVNINGYADDHSLRTSFKAVNTTQEEATVLNVKHAVSNIASSMDEMQLKLNCNKTEAILFGNPRQMLKCKTKSLELDSNLIELSTFVKYLGGGLDTSLTFQKHVGSACSKAMANFVRIMEICKFLNHDACETLMLGLCRSHLDYANAILYG